MPSLPCLQVFGMPCAFLSTVFLAFGFAAPAGAQILLPEEVLHFADIVLYNGKVLTVDRDDANFSEQQAVAIRDGKFLAVGGSERILSMAGPNTRKIDLQGRTVVPGFVNSGSGAFASGDWSKTTQVGSQIVLESGSEEGPPSMQKIVASIRSLAARAKPGDLIYLAAPDAYPAELRAWTFRDLDSIVNENPMAIVMGGSNVVANSAMMPLAVIQQVVTRKDQNGKVWGAQQAIDRKTALLLCTRRAADFIDRSQAIGSIDPGKLADLVVLGGDFLEVPDDQIASIPVEMTMVGGAVVYERDKN